MRKPNTKAMQAECDAVPGTITVPATGIIFMPSRSALPGEKVGRRAGIGTVTLPLLLIRKITRPSRAGAVPVGAMATGNREPPLLPPVRSRNRRSNYVHQFYTKGIATRAFRSRRQEPKPPTGRRPVIHQPVLSEGHLPSLPCWPMADTRICFSSSPQKMLLRNRNGQ